MALTDVKTVWFNWISEGFTDDNRDYVRSAKGLDGILYTLIECTHNPSHGLQSQWLTDSRPRDKLTPYPIGGSCWSISRL